MTGEEWGRVLQLRRVLWPASAQLPRQTAEEWRSILNEVPAERLEAALRQHRRVSPWAPSPDQWLALSETILRRSERGRAIARLEEMGREERTPADHRAALVALSIVLDGVPLCDHDEAWRDRGCWTDAQLAAAINIAKTRNQTPNLAKALLAKMVERG